MKYKILWKSDGACLGMKFIPHTILSVTPFMHAQYNFLQLLSRPSVEISAVLISWSHLSRIAQQYTVVIIIWLLPSLPRSLSAFGLLMLLLLAPLHLPINTQSQIHQPQQPFGLSRVISRHRQHQQCLGSTGSGQRSPDHKIPHRVSAGLFTSLNVLDSPRFNSHHVHWGYLCLLIELSL